jgi:hypothetical protein
MRQGGAFHVDHSLAVTISIRQQSRAASEFADAEMGAALTIERKRAEKIVKRQEEAGADGQGSPNSFRRYDLRRSVLIRVLRRDASG